MEREEQEEGAWRKRKRIHEEDEERNVKLAIFQWALDRDTDGATSLKTLQPAQIESGIQIQIQIGIGIENASGFALLCTTCSCRTCRNLWNPQGTLEPTTIGYRL